ncbi:dual specificity tyrosine-phosphorylation-regulated kinase 4-like [Lampris incognitus]|uniref:dual specificity tyrosine-phosphorylation-regulated kinase 4-like n=1 Tax=Lampris incognitus TaxID=2546036 RepID=UPI0024B4FD3E|nr:dual specificity tyrosine-phosphorylation-regulated kinase 4-like [Lampris incognitus]XP_056131849.1 dual specificity tyrosine-phosphorylation-regulated kinase 4-like [Lampris incognitus]
MNREEEKKWRKKEEKLLYEKNGRSQQKQQHSKSKQKHSELKQQHSKSKAPCPKEEKTDFKPSLGKQRKQKHRSFMGLRLPMSPGEVLEAFGHRLTEFEREEILNYSEIWYLGLHSPKINGSKSSPHNNGYDDPQTYYLQVLHDHIAYRYEVLEVLGQGTYGQVLKCWDVKEREFVAMKLLRSKKCYYQFGKREVKILEALRKKDEMNVYNIVRKKDHFHFRKHLCITFELLGETLYRKANADESLSTAEVRKYASSLLKCLSLLKKEKLMHCDLKPENIVLSSRKPHRLKVIDFGISRYEKEARAKSYIQTRPYRAPEAILGHVCSVAVDMWSLGCIIFELCTGQELFRCWDNAEHLSLMIEALGTPPQGLLASAPNKKKFFDSKGVLIHKQKSEKEMQQPRRKDLASMLRTKEPHLLDFIKRCLVWDPSKRMTPDKAMQHPWILQHKESSGSKFGLKRQVTTTDVARNSVVGMEADLLSRRKLCPARLPRLEATKKAQVQQKANRAEKAVGRPASKACSTSRCLAASNSANRAVAPPPPKPAPQAAAPPPLLLLQRLSRCLRRPQMASPPPPKPAPRKAAYEVP